MKAAEIKDKTKVELSAQSRELRQELFNLRLQKATSQLEKPIRLRELRRDIARVETRLSQLERKDALGQAASALEGVSDFNVDGVAAAGHMGESPQHLQRAMLKVFGHPAGAADFTWTRIPMRSGNVLHPFFQQDSQYEIWL